MRGGDDRRKETKGKKGGRRQKGDTEPVVRHTHTLTHKQGRRTSSVDKKTKTEGSNKGAC